MNPSGNIRKKRRRCCDGNPLLFLVLIQSCWFVAYAEDNRGGSMSQQTQTNQNFPKNHGVLTFERYCRKRAIEVTKVSLTCDSPGAYYYGSKTYRNSVVCIDGDKVNLKVHLTISESVDPSSTIYLEINAGLYDKYKQVVSPYRLCQMQISAVQDTNIKCPRPGDYVLQSHFYLPNLIGGDDKDFHYTPDVNLTFTDENYNRLGCAVTGTAALHRQAYLRRRVGMIALGLALAIFAVVFCGLLLLAYRRKKRLESLNERKTQRYQYFKTLPNGQVVPFSPGQLPGAPRPPPPVPQPVAYQMPPHSVPYQMPPHPVPYQMPPHPVGYPGPPQEAYQISNPAYNETQLPTRPVI